MKFSSGGQEDGRHILRLKDGESVRGVFRGDPVEFRQHWVGPKPDLCQGAVCQHCKAGDKPSFRFRLNFITKENGVECAKIVEQGWRVYQDLKALHENDYNLERTILKITRSGSTKNDTQYSLIPVPGGTLTDAQDRALATIQLHTLSDTQKPSQGNHRASETYPDDGDDVSL